LKASAFLGAAIQAFELQTGFFYAADIEYHLPAVHGLDVSLWKIECTHAVGPSAVLSRHHLRPGDIVGAETARRLDMRLETGPDLPLLLAATALVVAGALPLPSGSLYTNSMTGGRTRQTSLVVVIVILFFVFVFGLLVLCLFATELAFDLVHVNPNTVLSLGTLAFLGNLAHGEPAVQSKVDGLGAVVTEVVARVVTVGVRDHEFARVRQAFVNRDTVMLFQVGGRDEECLVPEELITSLCFRRPYVFHRGFEAPCVGLGDAVPLLRGAEVKIVDAV